MNEEKETAEPDVSTGSDDRPSPVNDVEKNGKVAGNSDANEKLDDVKETQSESDAVKESSNDVVATPVAKVKIEDREAESESKTLNSGKEDVNETKKPERTSTPELDDDDDDIQFPAYDGDATIFRKPMEYGWCREIVIRANVEGTGRWKQADVYYFTPVGRKLRSMPQICDYLESPRNQDPLQSCNFTFRKVTVYKPPFEVVRNAGKQQRRGKIESLYRNRSTKITNKVLNTVKASILPGTNAPSVPAKVEAQSSKPGIAAGTSFLKVAGPYGTVKTFMILNNRRPEIKLDELSRVNISENRNPEFGVKKSTVEKSMCDDANVEKDKPATQVSETIPRRPLKARKSFVKKRPLEDNDETWVKKRKSTVMCGMECPGLEGTPPSLVCKVCQRLFHHICVQVHENTCYFCCDMCSQRGEQFVNDPLCVTNYTTPISAQSDATPISIATQSYTHTVPLVQSSLLPSTASVSLLPPGPTTLQPLTQWTPSPALQPVVVTSLLSPPMSSPMSATSAPSLPIIEPVAAKRGRPVHSLRNLLPKDRSRAVRLPPPLVRMPTLGRPRKYGTPPPPVVPSPALGTHPSSAVPSAALGALPPLTVPSPPVLPPAAPPLRADIPMPPCSVTSTTPSTSMTTDVPPSPSPKALLTSDSDHKGQLLSLPASVLGRLKRDGPIDLKVNGQLITVQQNDFVQTQTGTKIYLPNDSVKVASGQAFSVSIPANSLNPALNKDETNVPLTTPVGATTKKNKNKNNKSTAAKLVIPAVKKKTKQPVQRFDDFLLGYEYMNRVFSYLELPELLRARLVCKKWRNLVDKHGSFLNVALDEEVIKDWDKFGDFLVARKTETLDLTELELRGKFSKEWKKFETIVPKLRFLTRLSLGVCPPSVLYAVSQDLPYLECLTAEQVAGTNKEPDMWYCNTELDLGKLCTLRSLRELRLRGVSGLTTPNMAYSSHQRLSQLKQLRKLSITSLKNVDGFELSFLESLTDLEELEIGDCDTWTEETYAYLNSLKLTKLHLENGGDSNRYLTLSLPNWQSLRELDLIMIGVDESLGRGLSKLVNLESLSVCPDTRDNDALTNRNTLLAVRELKHLKYFLWCAVMSSGGDSENEMEFLRQGIEDSLFYGETGRPPPELMNSDDESSDEEDKADLNIDDELALIEGREIEKKQKRRSRSMEERKDDDDDDEEQNEELDEKTKSDRVVNVSENEVEDKVKSEENNNGMTLPTDDKDHSALSEVTAAEETSKSKLPEGGALDSVVDTDMEVEESVSLANDLDKAKVIGPIPDTFEKSEPVVQSTDDVVCAEKMEVDAKKTEVDAEKMEDDAEKMAVDLTRTENEHLKPEDGFRNEEETNDKETSAEPKEEDVKDSMVSDMNMSDKVKSDSSIVNESMESQKSPKKRRRRRKVSLDVEPRRSGRRRTLKRSDDSEIAFVDVDTLISILEFHLPYTDIRVDPIEMMK